MGENHKHYFEEDCIELMNQRQMKLTRLRQIGFKLSYRNVSETEVDKLAAEKNILHNLLDDNETLKDKHLEELKTAIRANESPTQFSTKFQDQVLEEVSTKSLVEELEKREGVKSIRAGFEEKAKAAVDGPAILIKVID